MDEAIMVKCLAQGHKRRIQIKDTKVDFARIKRVPSPDSTLKAKIQF